MFALLKISILKEYRNKYTNQFSWIGQVLTELALLSVYWYTAKAFVPNLQFLDAKTDYFSFLVVGETSLLLPSLLITGFARIFKSELQQGTLEPGLLASVSLSSSWLIQALALLIVESLRIFVVLALAFGLFHFQAVSFSSLAMILSLQMLSLPFFAGIGMISAALMMNFGRGDRLLPMLTTAMTVLAGAYFPPSVLPEKLQTGLQNLSPMSVLLGTTRELLKNDSSGLPSTEIWWHSSGFLAGGSVMFLLIGIVSLQLSVKRYRNHSQPLLFLS